MQEVCLLLKKLRGRNYLRSYPEAALHYCLRKLSLGFAELAFDHFAFVVWARALASIPI